MSENLRRGFGRKIIYRKEDIFLISRNWKSLEDSEPDYLYYWDSDNGFYHEAVKIETASEGLVPEDYNVRKLSYRYFNASDSDFDQDLLNGYEIPASFDSKEKVYEIGHIVPISEAVIINDSEGGRIWQKQSGFGVQKSDFKIREFANEGSPNLSTATAQYTLDYQLNTNFDLTQYTGFRLSLFGEELIDNKVDSERIFTHGEFNGKIGPVVQIINRETNTLISVESFQNAIVTSTAGVGSENTYTNVVSEDSDSIIMNMGGDLPNFDGYNARFARQSGDSEVEIISELYINPKPVQYPKTPANADSDIFEAITLDGNSLQHHENNEPWKVFSDSDNEGFKALLGVASAVIGINKDSDFAELKTLSLKRAHFRNPLATPAPNRPYNFRIQTYDPKRSPNWQIIHTETEFTGYNFTKTFDSDSEQFCSRVRFIFDDCQPNFDSDVNALEVSKIEFEFEEYDVNIGRKNISFFVDNPGIEYTFKIIDSDIVDVRLVSGGGGGGGGSAGAGGCGGSTVVAEDVALLPGTYAIRSGAGGLPGQDGGESYFRDVTRDKKLVSVSGSTAGGAGDTNNWSTHGGTPGDLTYDSEVVGSIKSWIPGQPGGLGAQLNLVNGFFVATPGEDGGEGTTLRFRSFDTATTVKDSEHVFGSGGGGGGYYGGSGTPAAAHGVGGTNAGDGIGPSKNGVDGYGGGGGGTRRINNLYLEGAGEGGNGYAYITFAGNK